MAKKPQRPKDTNQLAKLIVDIATGEQEETKKESSSKNVHAVELGRMGGLKGGKARAASLSKKRRKEIATKAAKKRWKKKR